MVFRLKIYYLIQIFIIIQMQAYGQVIKAYDDYITIGSKKTYVTKITHNDNYSG